MILQEIVTAVVTHFALGFASAFGGIVVFEFILRMLRGDYGKLSD